MRQMQGDYQAALQSYQGALEIDPQYRDALYRKGISLLALGQRQEAEGIFDQVLDIDPGYRQAANAKGVTVQSQGEYEEAVELFENASQMDPSWSQPRLNQVSCLISLQRMQEAMTAYAAI